MPTPVKLKNVVEALDLVSDQHSNYLDKRTGEVVMITDEEMSAAKQDELMSEYPEWQRESVLKAREILGSDDFVALPGQFEINEWEIMREFGLSLEDREVGEELLGRIRGSGAFGRFRDAVSYFGIESIWYQFRQEEIEKIAIEWLEDEGIPYRRDDEIEAMGQSM